AVRRARIAGRAPVCRLEDVLEDLPGTAFNIDVKSPDAVEPVVRTILRMGVRGRVAVASFSAARLCRVRRLAGPNLATALTPRATGLLRFGGPLRLPPRALLPGMMAQVPVRVGRLRLVDRHFVRTATRCGIEVHVWTVNDAPRMHNLLDLGVSGIITDRPDLLREVLIERGEWQEHTVAYPTPHSHTTLINGVASCSTRTLTRAASAGNNAADTSTTGRTPVSTPRRSPCS